MARACKQTMTQQLQEQKCKNCFHGRDKHLPYCDICGKWYSNQPPCLSFQEREPS
jgi:hypothetical protein